MVLPLLVMFWLIWIAAVRFAFFGIIKTYYAGKGAEVVQS